MQLQLNLHLISCYNDNTIHISHNDVKYGFGTLEDVQYIHEIWLEKLKNGVICIIFQSFFI